MDANQEAPPPRAPFELVWRCMECGEVFPRGDTLPAGCPLCQAPPTELVLVEED